MSEIISYCFRDIKGQVIHSKDSETSLVPASNMKIVSGYAAYKLLGKDHVITTLFSLVKGRLYVSGGPTPLLDRKGLSDILGVIPHSADISHIVFDTTILDSKGHADGWNIGDIGYCYQAPIAPFSVEEGCYSNRKKKADDGEALHDFANRSVKDQLSRFSEEVSRITGSKVTFSVDKSEPEGQVIRHEEKLNDILDHIETYSCNFSIELLSKYMAHHKTGKPGSWQDYSMLVRSFVDSLGLNSEDLNFADGSGLSRANLLSTSFLSLLIQKIVENGDIGFIHMLPSPGEGTLKNRLAKHSGKGLFAKTGSLGQVASLTGYIEDLGTSFSIIINNSMKTEKEIKKTIDSIVSDFISKQNPQGAGN